MKTTLVHQSLLKSFLFICLFTNLSLKVNAQLCLPAIANNSNCPIKICADGGWDCNRDGRPDQMVVPTCVTIQPNSSGQICFDVTPREGCTFIVTSYTFINISTGNSVVLNPQETATFNAFLNSGQGGQYSLPVNLEFPENDCLNTILFNNNEDGTISITDRDCPKICFRNETGCPISIYLFSNTGGYTVNCNPSQSGLQVTATLNLCDGCSSGNEACFSFPTTSEGCPICVKLSDVLINICAQDPALTPPCVPVTINQGGQGYIKCSDGSTIHVGITFVNGVYIVRKI
jgi:hypothetical protein